MGPLEIETKRGFRSTGQAKCRPNQAVPRLMNFIRIVHNAEINGKYVLVFHRPIVCRTVKVDMYVMFQSKFVSAIKTVKLERA